LLYFLFPDKLKILEVYLKPKYRMLLYNQASGEINSDEKKISRIKAI